MNVRLKALKDRAISNLPLVGKICYYLGILQLWYEEDPHFYRARRCERINPWNPLSYLAAFICILINMIIGAKDGFVTYCTQELPKFFKTDRN